MSEATHALVRQFFADLGAGTLGEDTFTADAEVWTATNRALSPAQHYRFGTGLLVSLFQGGLTYTIASITAEDDRAAAQVSAEGVFEDGEPYANDYVFAFRIADGRIASLAEYFDTRIVDALIMPRMAAKMAAMQQRP